MVELEVELEVEYIMMMVQVNIRGEVDDGASNHGNAKIPIADYS